MVGLVLFVSPLDERKETSEFSDAVGSEVLDANEAGAADVVEAGQRRRATVEEDSDGISPAFEGTGNDAADAAEDDGE